jgi:hypothetical protein
MLRGWQHVGKLVNQRRSAMKLKQLITGMITILFSWLCVLPPTARAQQEFFVKPVVEKRLTQLPGGPLYWQIENFPTLAQAQAAAGPTSLAAEVAGKVWLFTLGVKGSASTRASGHGARIFAAYQLRWRSSGGEDFGAYPPRFGSFLRDFRPSGPEDAAWGQSC